MNKRTSFPLMVMVICFITGNLIGAGILGLPIKTGMAGLLPSLAGILVISCAMFITAFILAKESTATHQEVFHYPSMYQKYFGSIGKWGATIANLIILYGSLLVYITGATAIIIRFANIHISRELIILLFFLPVTAITIAKPKSLLRCNALFVGLLLISFVVIVVMGEKHVDPQRYWRMDWTMLPAALPIIIMAANFHNIIPTVCKQLDWNFKKILIAIFSGTVIGFIMNGLWVQVGIGVLPFSGSNGIVHALDNNLPATLPLSQAIKTPFFVPVSVIFSLLAIITSYISFGNTTIEFVDDLMINHFKIRNKALTIAAAFIPPLVIAIVYPNIFLCALDFVGGIGVVILFGIFPCVIGLKLKGPLFRRLVFFIPVFILFTAILLFKVQQELGMSRIKPRVEYWTNFRFFSYHNHK
ncbi:MAG: aromatic amino acid transport family protein [Candidatus Omnitrophica bacterium]|nr:aromatic amino acid transport family protein [Candidatus Omnitrophota bacterium]MDD5691376.1 aromatic amino acid transport family protein [Candidatus Omnitrophota bacterium]